MALLRVRRMTIFLFVTTSLFIGFGNGERTSKKIYIDLTTQSACFRLLNSTHEVGCTSGRSGNVGTVHYIQSQEDFQWIMADGPHDPYVAVLNGEDFTGHIVETLHRSKRVNGIMVINLPNSTHPSTPSNGFSSVDTCPNDDYGLYSNNSEYGSCRKLEWNTAGSSLLFQDIGIPVFALSIAKDVDSILNKCYFRFNEPLKNKSRSYPVCSAEMKSVMDGAVNSVTCMRRSNRFALSETGAVGYCDPLGDYNVAATMMENPHNDTRKPDSVVLIGARLDSTALFTNEYRASDTTVAGFVTLLAAAEALWKVKDTIQQDSTAKDIMFTFFQGESFDYIGSSRMVYEMNEGNFPASTTSDDSPMYLPKMNLKHINQLLEVNQVGLRDDGSLWSHTDPLSRSQVATSVDAMVQELIKMGQAANVSIKKVENSSLPLPPASAQWFLKHRLDIPTIVLTDHKREFTNKFYNSRLDHASNIDASDYPPGANASVMYNHVTTQAKMIASLSTALSHYLYKASTGKDPTQEMTQNLTADPMTITHLLYCFLISPNCDLFQESVDDDMVDSLQSAKQPFPFYITVDGSTSQITTLVYRLLARFTGEKVMLDESDCKPPSKDKRYTYIWMQGGKISGTDIREGWCIRSTSFQSKAYSPAWDIEDYDFDSGQYSTWTESRWGSQAIGVRLFLVPSPKFEVSVLLTGIFLFLASLVLVYFCNRRSHLIFCPTHRQNSSSYNLI